MPLTTLDLHTALIVIDLRKVFPRVGETALTKEIISLLERLLEERNTGS